jgi:hypothetical protein
MVEYGTNGHTPAIKQTLGKVGVNQDEKTQSCILPLLCLML